MLTQRYASSFIRRYVLTLFTVAILFSFSLPVSATSSGPKIAFDVVELDIGQIVPGDKAAGVFTVKNEGDDTLKIKRVAPT